MPRVNILKQVKVDGRWKLVAVPKNGQGKPHWKALPEGRYFIEWHEAGKRRRQSAGSTTAAALEIARRKRHVLESRALGMLIPGEDDADERTPLHVRVTNYLEVVEALKKPNTLRKYESVLDRFVEYFGGRKTPKTLTPDDLNEFMVHLKKDCRLGNNTVVHNLVIVAQFLKKCGRPGLTGQVDLPDRIESLPEEYDDEQLQGFFGACSAAERALYTTFLLTGFREMEVVHLIWSDVNTNLKTVRVTAKPDLGFYPKRWEEREVPVPGRLIDVLLAHPRRDRCRFVFPSPPGNREYHMLDLCKRIAERAKLDSEKFTLRKFRSTYATRMLRAGFDVRTVQHWMGHKSLETTMRYLSPARDVHDRLDRIQIAGILNGT